MYRNSILTTCRNLLITLFGLTLPFGASTANGEPISPADFAQPVPVLMNPEWGDLNLPFKPSVTPDGKSLSFKQFFVHQVHTAEWNESNQRWENITHVTGLGQSWTSASSISPDKQWLFYVGSSGTAGDIYRSPWLGDHWGVGQPIFAVNDPFGSSNDPYFNGQRLYFTGTTSVVDPSDIYYSDYDSSTDTFGVPVAVGVSMAGFDDRAPTITPDGQTLFWQSFGRPGGFGGEDIWMASWDSNLGIWTNIENAGPIINDSGDQNSPSYSSSTLYFTDSNRTFVQSSVVPEPIILTVDIKPASDPNSINLGNKGVLPVAIFTTDDFDVLEIDDDTLFFGDPDLIDLGFGNPVSPVRITLEDVDGDEDLDLLLFFSIVEIVEEGALDKESEFGLLIGETLDGVPIEGVDSVRIVSQ